MLLILCVVSFEYAEGHHDPPLVTLFAVTELDLCRHDPDGISIDIDVNINIIAFDYRVYFDKKTLYFLFILITMLIILCFFIS